MRFRTTLAELLLPALLSASPVYKITNPNPRTAVVERDGKPIFTAKFDKPQELHDQQVSPSGYYVFIWHDDRLPRHLTIYRLTDSKPIADFVPGVGGTIQWTLGDKLLHTWGAGTNCENINVYDVTGATLESGNYTGILPTDRGFYVTYPTIDIAADHRVVKHDVSTGTSTVLFDDPTGNVSDVHVDKKLLMFNDGRDSTHQIPLE